MTKWYSLVLAGLLITMLALAVPVSGAVLTLNPGDPIQQNITKAHSGDVIVLNPGTYYQSWITVTTDITIRANASRGGTMTNTIIDAGGDWLFYDEYYSLTLDNLTLQNAYNETMGGAIQVAGGGYTLTITSCNFSADGSGGYNGGAIYSGNVPVHIKSSIFSDCYAGNGGAILAAAAPITIENSTFSNCTATGYGGAVYSTSGGSTVSITASAFTGCSAGDSGSVLHFTGDTAEIHFSRIYGNTDGPSGKAVFGGGANQIDASDNWWGTNSDPSGFTSSGVSVPSWLVLGASATPPSISTIGTSRVRANLTCNNTGYNTSLSGHVPDGIPVAFAVTGGTGSIGPAGGNTTSGLNATTFTPGGTGTSTVSVTIDGITVPADITVSRVHTLDPGDSIQQNITDAAAGDTIVLNPGIYRQSLIMVTKNIGIMVNSSAGGTAENTIINGMTDRIFTIGSGSSFAIDNLTLQNGSATEAGAIFASSGSSLTINSSVFRNFNAGSGGAISTSSTPVNITSTAFSDCSATTGGAAAFYGSAPVFIISSTFTGCSAATGGALYRQDGPLTLRFSRIHNCTASAVVNSGGSIDAADNWWGTNDDPSGFTAGGVTVAPWLVMNISANPATVTTSRPSFIRVNITNTSAGTDTAGGGIFVPDGIPINLTGHHEFLLVLSVWPGTIAAGSNVTTFTPAAPGKSWVSATVDGQTVSAPVFVPVDKIGVRDGAVFALDNDGSFGWNAGDLAYTFGSSGDTAVAGDWDHDGLSEIGVFNGGTWYLDYNGNGVYDGPFDDRAYAFGSAGYKPVTGDWNGDGNDEIGVQLNGIWAVDFNGNGVWEGEPADRFAALGQNGDIPVAGDWNGDGRDEIGSHLDGFWAVDYNGNYLWDGTTDDRFAGLGQAADKPVTGDFNGDGKDEIGMETDGFWAIDYDGDYVWDGIGDDRFAGLGQAGDTPVIGDFDGNGKTEICSFVNGFWAVDYNGNYAWDGVTDDRFAGFGSATAVPVVGAWS